MIDPCWGMKHDAQNCVCDDNEWYDYDDVCLIIDLS